MTSEREDDRIVALQPNAGAAAAQSEELPFAVELCDAQGKMERVIARATSGQLARAIFTSAQKEFPDRRILVRRGAQTVLDTKD